MFRRIRSWFRHSSQKGVPGVRGVKWVPQGHGSTTAQSTPFSVDTLSGLEHGEGCLPPPGSDPRLLFPLLRRLRDYLPDVSAGVWAWVRLCSTPQSYTFSEGSETEQAQSREILEELDRRLGGGPGQEHGVEALVQAFFLSVFTYGSFCGEVILDDARRRIERFVVIDPATIRFRLDPQSRLYSPSQIQPDNSLIALNPASFFYHGLDTDGLSPYGRSPLLALPLMIRLQQQLLHDMTRAQHNAGYPTVHFRVAPLPRQTNESMNEYHQRLNQELNLVQEELRRKETDSNLITYDNVEVQYIGPGGNAHRWSESLQAISEQVIAALHLAPFMIGRNWGTTQTWGTAQYQLLTNNARSVQEGAKHLAEWLRNLELTLHGSPLRVTHQFAPHHHLDTYDRARAFQISARTLLELSEKGFLEAPAAKQHMQNLLRFF